MCLWRSNPIVVKEHLYTLLEESVTTCTKSGVEYNIFTIEEKPI